jgi:hypothetical protein
MMTEEELRRRILRQLDRAIEDLRAARRNVENSRLERAEDNIANALTNEARALRNINRLERLRNQ